jgi:hypothetical protein
MIADWEVELSREAKKQYKKLAASGLKKPSIIDVIDALVLDLEIRGPVLNDWPHYGIIQKNKREFYYHCHLRQGRPTYVACWKANTMAKKIEVFYVGSHEDAPY